MKKMRSGLLVGTLLGLCCMAAPAVASIMVDHPTTGNVTSGFDSVGRLWTGGVSEASGVAVFGGGYVLTRHAVTMDNTIAGALRPASQVQFQAGGATYDVSAIRADFGGDLALVTLTGTAPSWSKLYTSSNELSQQFIAAGHGAAATPAGYWETSLDGQKRQFANTIESAGNGAAAGQGQILQYWYDVIGGVPEEGNCPSSGPRRVCFRYA